MSSSLGMEMIGGTMAHFATVNAREFLVSTKL